MNVWDKGHVTPTEFTVFGVTLSRPFHKYGDIFENPNIESRNPKQFQKPNFKCSKPLLQATFRS